MQPLHEQEIATHVDIVPYNPATCLWHLYIKIFLHYAHLLVNNFNTTKDVFGSGVITHEWIHENLPHFYSQINHTPSIIKLLPHFLK